MTHYAALLAVSLACVILAQAREPMVDSVTISRVVDGGIEMMPCASWVDTEGQPGHACGSQVTLKSSKAIGEKLFRLATKNLQLPDAGRH